jgi:hypothetical protein
LFDEEDEILPEESEQPKKRRKKREPVKKEWTATEINDTMRYVIVMYDPHSPVTRAERDISRRREEAAKIALFPDEHREAMFDCTYPLLVPLVLGYLRHFAKAREYAAIIATEMKYWEAIDGIMQPVKGKGDHDRLKAIELKSKLAVEADLDLVRLEGYEMKFYGGDELLHDRAKKRLTPEGMAKLKTA